VLANIACIWQVLTKSWLEKNTSFDYCHVSVAVEWLLQNLLFYDALFGFVVNLDWIELLAASLRRIKSFFPSSRNSSAAWKERFCPRRAMDTVGELFLHIRNADMAIARIT
jgi:hypothetical protein